LAVLGDAIRSEVRRTLIVVCSCAFPSIQRADADREPD